MLSYSHKEVGSVTQVILENLENKFEELIASHATIKTRITGEQKTDTRKCHSLRHAVVGAFSKVEPLTDAEEFWVASAVGEIIDNAFIHSKIGGYVVANIEAEPHHLKLVIANPDVDDFDVTSAPALSGLDAESGRGRIFVETALDELKEAGFQANCHYKRTNHRLPPRVIAKLELLDGARHQCR